MPQTLKQQALEAISKMPEDAKLDDIMYRLYVLDQIAKGLEAVDKGDIISVEDLKREVASW